MAKTSPRASAVSRESIEVLRQVSSILAVSGHEKAAADFLKKRLGFTKVAGDRMGNVFCTLKGTSDRPRLLLAAHMDEVGMMVKMIDERGYLRFHQIGRWWPQALAAQRVNVVNSRGEVLPGVIGSKPPHLMSEEEKNRAVKLEELFIDVGATSKEDAEKRLGIVPGDVILPESPFTEMAGGQRLISKAWDDRAGVATMIRVMDLLKSQKHPNTVIGCGTVQEEVGFRGAKTVAATVEPDVALILEVAITGDLPGMKPEEAQGELGKGPMLCIFDGGMIPSRPLRDFVAETAQKTGIAIQFTSLAGGFTDGAQIHSSGRGVPSLYLGVPCRYVHAHHSVIDAEDFENTVRLVTEVVLRLDEKAFAKIAGE